jgi:predicted transcriptional regulator
MVASRKLGRPRGSVTLRGKARLVEYRGVYPKLGACGQIVREQREAQGISARELARACGIHPGTLLRFERGYSSHGLDLPKDMKLSTIFKIAIALGLMPSELMP